MHTNGHEDQVVVGDSYSPLVRVACEYLSLLRFNKLYQSFRDHFSVRAYGNHADDRISDQKNLLLSGESRSQSAQSSVRIQYVINLKMFVI